MRITRLLSLIVPVTLLATAGLAKQKWPESLHLVTELPRTPSGKVKKYVLQAGLEPAGKEGP